MKKLLICSMMCLMALVAKAQVLTSATVQKVYESVTTDVDNGFAYNAECDGDGRIIAMEVYRKKLQRKVGVTLILPVSVHVYGGRSAEQSHQICVAPQYLALLRTA